MTKPSLEGRPDVVLVAHEPRNCEHLGIRLVAAGLAEAGFRPHVLPVTSPAAVAAAVTQTLALRPFLVGVSISDPLVAPPMLAFVHLLRQRGFAGHITVGGTLATLERARLLADHPAIDSVVRHAGEAAIVALARALCEGQELRRVPGLSTRLGEGSGNPHAFTASRLWPLRAETQPTLLGIPKADVAASRGCAGHCDYCGVSALEHDLANERRLLGLAPAHPRGSVHRPIDDLADEVAALYHDRSVRVAHLVDDNLLGFDPQAAQAWLADLEAALKRRRVGAMAWRLMAEPSVLSDGVVDALARLGALFVLVGIESLTPQGKSALGRRGNQAADLACLHRLAARGIAPTLNLLALRPGGTLDDTCAELAGLARLHDFAWEVVPLTVWPGTALAAQLAAKGQLAGRGAGMVWLPGEPEIERFLFALNRLRMGGLAWVTRQPCALDIMFALRVSHRLGLAGGSRGLIDRAQALLVQAQHVRLRILEQGLALATSSLSPAEFGQAVEALQQQAARQLAPFDAGFSELLDEVTWPDSHAPDAKFARRLASPWLAHGLMMAMAAGCGNSGTGARDASRPMDDAAADVAGIYLPDLPAAAPVEAATAEAQPLTHECPSDGGANTSLDGSCNVDALDVAVERTVIWPCHMTEEPYYGGDLRYAVVIDCEGRAIELLRLPDQTPMLSGDARDAWLASLANDRWTCFAGQSVQFSCMICLFP
jgi:hypothetical protein